MPNFLPRREVWGFAKSRLVCLSTEEPSDPLELTMIYINTTDYKETGQVAVFLLPCTQ